MSLMPERLSLLRHPHEDRDWRDSITFGCSQSG